MFLPRAVADNKLTSFVLATLFLQLFIILCASLIVGSAPLTTEWRKKLNLDVVHTSIDELSKQVAARSDEQPINNDSNLVGNSDQNVAAPDSASSANTQSIPSEMVIHVVRSGETLTKIWKAHNAPVAGALAADKALSAVKETIPGLRSGEKIELKISSSGEIVFFRRKIKDGRSLILEGDSIQGYTARVEESVAMETHRTAGGTIVSSFSAAAVEASVPYAVIDDLVDLFSGRLEFRKDLHKGDSFSVIFSERRLPNGELVQSGPIKAASLQIDGKMLVAVRYESKNGDVRYFDEQGEPLGSYYLRYPLQFSRISSVFSTARFHPLLQLTRPHNGVDFAAPIGTPVRSVADGVIVSAGYAGEGGNMVKIQHDGRFSTAYLHLSRIGAGLHAGSRVKRGQVIGAVGATGLATGPHLHFSLYDRGNYVNPLTASLPKMPEHAERIPQQLLVAALKTLRQQHDAVQLAEASGEPSHRA